MRKFKVESPYEPAGDQGQAIEKLSQGFFLIWSGVGSAKISFIILSLPSL